MKGRYDKKVIWFSSANPPECGRFHNVLLSLFDILLSKVHIRLKVPSGEYGLSFVAFKKFFIMSAFHIMRLMS
jgi:hypothetical protein